MKLLSPRDMPRLRFDTSTTWQAFAAMQRYSVEGAVANRQQLGVSPPQARRRGDPGPPEKEAGIRRSAQTLDALAKSLRAASLWWVTADMTKLAQHAGPTLPDWTPTLFLPDDHGLLLWQDGLGYVEWLSAPDELITRNSFGRQVLPTVVADGMVWSTRNGILSIVMVTLDPMVSRGFGFPAPPGRALLSPAAELPDIPLSAIQEPRGDAMPAKLLAVIGATWALMQQPTLVTAEMVRDGVKGRAADFMPDTEREVTIVDLRRVQAERETAGDSDPPGHHLTNRHLVRGHWRQQACGPARSQRKPVWIAPHIKGPDGAPLVTGETVNVWKR